jgi:Domain of unknown function (DUF1707)
MMSDSAQRDTRDTKDTRDESSRAADTDRIQTAQLLAYEAEQGRLQLKDYEDRLTRAYAATTYEELDELRADLPDATINPRRGGKPNPAPSTLLLALMSGFERRGRWNVPKKLTTFTLWGSGVLDLRYADFTSTEVDIKAISIVGQGTPGAPKVNIRGFSLWGGVGIKRKARRPLG